MRSGDGLLIKVNQIDADRIAASLRPIALVFSAVLVLPVPLGYLALVPDPTVGAAGTGTGLALGVVSWVAPRRDAGSMLDGVARRVGAGAAETVRSVGFLALVLAEVPGLLSLALATARIVDAGVMAPAMLVAAASVWFNAVGPSAVHRHLDRLRG